MKKILFILVLAFSFLAIACSQEVTVKINGENKVAVGAEITLTATTNSKEAVVWESTDPTIATVENGKVTGVKAGSVSIKASVEGVVAAHTVEVYIPAESVTLTGANKVKVGETVTLTAVITPSDADQALVWTSSNEAVATVANGVVTGVALGTATITATANGNVAGQLEISVVDSIVAVESVTINGEGKVYIGETVTLTAVVTPSDADQTVVWSSSDEKVATVANGVVTGVAAGTATITAAADGVEAQIEVKVSEKVASLDPVQLKEALNGIYDLYIGANNVNVKATLTTGEEVFAETLKYSYTETAINELEWVQESKATSSIYIKGGKAYVKFEEVNGYQSLSENDYAAYKLNYGVDGFLDAYLAFAKEDSLYAALELVSFEDNKNTYNLDLAKYTGTEISTAGKESVKLVVEVVEGVVTAVELTIVGEATTVLKVELGGTLAPTITFPEELSSYPKL